jgi:hypothetical protein
LIKRVAVEEELTDLRLMLTQRGYEVVKPGDARQADALIITGMDRNVMGMQDINVESLVIDASGRTPEEIFEKLEKF